MARVLVLYYSQSGETERMARRFAGAFDPATVAVDYQPIQAKDAYPYPWRSIRRFFDAMPESVLGLATEIAEPSFDPATRYDLIVLAYPVWFLSPALAIQGFFRSSHAEILKDADVITLSVSRAMWQRAGERMKSLLRSAGARHRGTVVVTHQGSPIATLISTPRTALFGKSDRLMGVFPEAGASDGDKERVDALGALLAERFADPTWGERPLLSGPKAVPVRKWLMVPEFLGRKGFVGWAHVIRFLGRGGAVPRAVGVYAFPFVLATMVVVGLPLVAIGTALSYPFTRRQLEAYAARLATPADQGAPTA